MWTTKEDPRLLVAEHAVFYLETTLHAKKLPFQYKKTSFTQGLQYISSILQRGRFSYLSYQDLLRSNFFEEIQKGLQQVRSSLPEFFEEKDKTSIAIHTLVWFISLIDGLEDRFRLSETTDIAAGIDYPLFKVLQVKPTSHKGISLLYVGHSQEKRQIITNVTSIKENMFLPIALIPPKIAYDHLSQGMIIHVQDQSLPFLTQEKLGTNVYPFLTDQHLGEVRGILKQFTR